MLFAETTLKAVFHVRVDGTEIHRGRTPLYYAAVVALEFVRNLPTSKGATIFFPGGGALTLILEDGEVTMQVLTRDPLEAAVSYADLLAEWERFSEDVARFFVKHHPELVTHKVLRGWLQDVV